MRIVALEEHFIVNELIEDRGPAFSEAMRWLTPVLRGRLADLDAVRLREMDEAGITVQVMSASMPGADLIDGDEGVVFARRVNDALATAVRRRPNRFAGFAHLPMRTPGVAADELERAVVDLGFRGAMINGTTNGRFLDHPDFFVLLERAAALGVPLYLHPNMPPAQVWDAYYSGLPGISGTLLATGAFGWHSETAIHVLRLLLSGTLDRHPALTLIVGHMGEMLPFMLDRADDVFAHHSDFAGSIGNTLRNRLYVTTSGFFTMPPFLAALATFGADRILFSVDYPFNSNATGKSFLDALPVNRADLDKIAHANADRLLKLDA